MSSTRIDKFTPETLATRYPDVVFSVPIYQRLFAWGKPQIDKLLEDLKASYKKDEPHYYLGILTIASNGNRLDLIDGQQRMTMLTLIAIALKEISGDAPTYWDKYLNSGRRLEFAAREDDTAYLQSRCRGEATGPYRNDMMENAIATIKSWIMTEFKGEEDESIDTPSLIKFSHFIRKRLTLFCSYLPDSYMNNPRELNRYFEAMNSTGRQLQQHEILLVKLVKDHPRSGTLSRLWNKIGDINTRFLPRGEEESVESYRARYLNLIINSRDLMAKDMPEDDDFSTIEDIRPQAEKSDMRNDGDSLQKMIISFEELLLMALELTLDEPKGASHYRSDLLLTQFDEAELKEKGLIDTFFDKLVRCRLLMDYKVVWQETGGDFDYDLISDDPGQRIEKFQSMLHVAFQNQFYRWLTPYIKWLSDNPSSTSCQEMDELLRIDRTLHPVLPKVEDLAYQSIESGKTERYWFWRLDYELWNKLESDWLREHQQYKEAAKRYIFRANRSVEHLHPQTPTDEKSEKWEGHDLNRFGNLAMISISFNSQQSNLPAGMKMKRIHHQVETSQLQSLKMLHMWIRYQEADDGSPADTWTRGKAARHEREMYRYLEDLYNPVSKVK